MRATVTSNREHFPSNILCQYIKQVIIVALLLFVPFGAKSLASPAASPENPAKTHIKNAESLMKVGKPFEAYQEAEAAVQADPSNKKFHDKLSQIGRAASQLAETKAQEQICGFR